MGSNLWSWHRAPNCQAKESGTGHAHHVGQFVGPLLLHEQRSFAAYDILGASYQESGCCVLVHRIPGNLFKDEAVVGLVLVESGLRSHGSGMNWVARDWSRSRLSA